MFFDQPDDSNIITFDTFNLNNYGLYTFTQKYTLQNFPPAYGTGIYTTIYDIQMGDKCAEEAVFNRTIIEPLAIYTIIGKPDKSVTF